MVRDFPLTLSRVSCVTSSEGGSQGGREEEGVRARDRGGLRYRTKGDERRRSRGHQVARHKYKQQFPWDFDVNPLSAAGHVARTAVCPLPASSSLSLSLSPSLMHSHVRVHSHSGCDRDTRRQRSRGAHCMTSKTCGSRRCFQSPF